MLQTLVFNNKSTKCISCRKFHVPCVYTTRNFPSSYFCRGILKIKQLREVSNCKQSCDAFDCYQLISLLKQQQMTIRICHQYIERKLHIKRLFLKNDLTSPARLLVNASDPHVQQFKNILCRLIHAFSLELFSESSDNSEKYKCLDCR